MATRRAEFHDYILDTDGRPIAAASIYVYQVDTTTAVTETIYADATGATALTNPLSTNSLGYVQFYLDRPKIVDLLVSKAGYTDFTLEDVSVMRAGAYGATLVVAASDALDSSKAMADYVCDGTADDVDINLAIAALPAGGKVLLTEGTFYITATIIPITGTTLEGVGNSTLLYLVSGTSDDVIGTLAGASTTDVIIRDLKIDGNKAGQTTTGHGINIDGADQGTQYIYISNVFIQNAEDSAIRMDARRYVIEGCNITDPTSRGIWVDCAGWSLSGRISNNYINGCGKEGIGVDSSIYRLTVTGNTAAGCLNGVAIEAAGKDIAITGNVFYGNTRGIRVVANGNVNVQGVSITGNVCRFNTESGINIEASVGSTAKDITIVGNTCMDNNQGGIDGDTPGLSGQTVEGGIRIGALASDILISGNTCTDNQGTPTQSYGVCLTASATGVTIRNNRLDGNAIGPFIDATTTKGNYILRDNAGCADAQVELVDDFDKYQTWVEAETPWILNKGSDGACADPVIVANKGGTVRLVTAAAAAMTVATDGCQIVGTNPWSVDMGSLVFEARLRIATAVTGVQICAGFTDVTTLEMPATISGTTITTNFSNGCVFVYDTTQTTDQWYAVGVATDTDATGNAITGTAPTADVYQRLRIEIDSAAAARFYIDDVLKVSLTANASTITTSLYPTVVVTGDSTAKTVDVDCIKVSANRPA